MKRFVDIITVLLLTASFGMAFYTGFIGKTAGGDNMLATNLFALMSMLGAAILFAIGTFSTVIVRSRMNLLTRKALIFAIVQFVSVVGICVIMSMLWMGMFKLENQTLRLLYLLFVAILLIGYVDSLLFADSLSKEEMLESADDEYDDVDILTPTVTIPPASRPDSDPDDAESDDFDDYDGYEE